MSTALLTKPHFLKPLLPGFEDDFLIPAAFCKYLKEQKCEKAILRSRKEGKFWPVKINGRRIEDGWKQFVEDHDLQIGDFLVFRHEGDLVFYVLVFDSTSCEREYEAITATTEEEENMDIREENLSNDSVSGKKFEVKKKVKTSSEAKASSSILEYPYSVIQLTSNSIKKSRLHIPQKFASEHGLYGRCCSIILKDEEGNGWPALLYKSSNGKTYIAGGWTSFHTAHKLKAGDILIVELTRDGKIPVLKMRRLQEHLEVKQEIMDNNNAEADSLSPGHLHATIEGSNLEKSQLQIPDEVAKASSSVLKHPNCVMKLTPDSIKKSRLYLRRDFARGCGLYGRSCSIVLKDEEERCWPAKLLYRNAGGNFYIGRGWGAFLGAHKLKAGDSFIIELIRNGETPVIKICKLQEHLEIEQEIMDHNNAEAGSLSPGHLHDTTEGSTLEKSQLQILDEVAKASPSVLEHPYYVIKLTPDSIKNSRLYIPRKFAREHGLYGRCCSIILKDEEENCQPAKLFYRSDGKFLIGAGWGAFVGVHKLNAGDLLIIELIQNGETPVMKIRRLQEHPEVEQETMDHNDAEADSSSPRNLHATTEASNLEKSQLIIPEEVAKTSGCGNKSEKRKIVKLKTRLEAKASSFSVLQHPNCVVIRLTPHSIKKRRLYIPRNFARKCCLYGRSCSMVLKDEEENCWPAKLLYLSINGNFYIGGGWGDFLDTHKLKAGDLLIVEVIKNGKTPVIKICRKKAKTRLEATKQLVVSSAPERPCCVIKLSPDSLKKSRLYIRRDFATECGLYNQSCSMVLKDEEEKCWPAKLLCRSVDGNFYIGGGWGAFVGDHKLKARDSLMIELIKNGQTPVMKISRLKKHPEVKQEFMNRNNPQADSLSPEHLHATDTEASNLEKSQLKIPEKVAKEPGLWKSKQNKQPETASEAKATSSVIQPRFFVVKIYDNWSNRRLYIPGKLVKLHLQNNTYSKVILIDREGRSWPANLDDKAYIADGWNDFRIATNLKPGDSFVFEFIEKGTIPTLKICEFKSNKEAVKNEETASSSIEKPYFYVTVKSTDIRNGQIRIPFDFARNNGLETSISSEMIIKNEMGNSWPVKTEMDKSEVLIRDGWSEFADANGIKEGDVFMLELVKEEGETPLMNYYAPKQEMDNNADESELNDE